MQFDKQHCCSRRRFSLHEVRHVCWVVIGDDSYGIRGEIVVRIMNTFKDIDLLGEVDEECRVHPGLSCCFS